MEENFIISKLNEIGRAVEKGTLRYVKIGSQIDESFGRCYVRWNVEVETTGLETHYYKDYESYHLWDSDHSFFNDEEYGKKHFKITMLSYYNDIRRFFELVASSYPEVKIINDICNFEIMDRKLFISSPRQISFIKKVNAFKGDEVTGQYLKINDRFEHIYLNHLTEEEINGFEDNHWLMQHKIWRDEQYAECINYPIRMVKYYDKNKDKLNRTTEYID
jgi:hypothetical protein